MASTSVVFDILAHDRASGKFDNVARAAQRSTGHMSKWGTALKASAAVGLGALTYGAIGFAKSAVEIEKQFSTSMRLIQAATHAPAAEMDKLNDLAIKLGADTSFSAGEAADAMLELAKAGLSTKTIMGGGVAGTLTLAAAGGTELGTAATIASNALNTFNLKGRDMAKVAAALAGGANASSASVESLGQGLQQVGPGATNAGLSLQETVAALSAFDAAGIKGSDAGTSLKTMLTRLVPTTDKAQTAMADLGLKFTNANGSFKSLTEISQILQDRLGGLSAEQRTTALATVFGSDATRAATVLMKQGADGIREYIKATNDQAAAQDMANARMGGTEGALERLSGSIETAKLRLGQELAPVIVSVADGLDDKLVPAMDSIIEGGKEIIHAVAPAFAETAEALRHLVMQGDDAGNIFEDTFIPALSTTANVVARVVDFIDDLPGPVKTLGAEAAVAAIALSKLSAVMAAVKASDFITTMGDAEKRTLAFAQAARTAAGIAGMVALAEGARETNDGMQALDKTLSGLLLGFSVGGPLGAAIGGVSGLASSFKDLQGVWNGLLGNEDEAAAQTKELAQQQQAAADAATRHKNAVEALRAALDAGKTSAASLEPAYANVVDQLNRNGVSADTAARQWRLLGISQRTVAQASLGNADAIRAINKAYQRAPG
jgi:TP901 family phage tail tape measure protein